jgi:hypothetical protein
MMNLAPLVVPFFLLQRYFIEGISLSRLDGWWRVCSAATDP